MNKPLKRGRRAGSPDTRARIQTAARNRFMTEGYQSVTLRAIAADADVDVALVSYYFKNKQGLFAAAMAIPVNPTDIIATRLPGDPAKLAARVLTGMLTIWDDPASGTALRTIAGAAAVDASLGRLVREAVGSALTGAIAGYLADELGLTDATARAAVFTAQMSGVVYSRYLVGLEPFASMDRAEIVRRLAPALQLTLTG